MSISFANTGPSSLSIRQMQVTFSTDADTSSYTPHQLGFSPGLVASINQNTPANTGKCRVTKIDIDNVYVEKDPVVGSGGAIIDIIMMSQPAGLKQDAYIKSLVIDDGLSQVASNKY